MRVEAEQTKWKLWKKLTRQRASPDQGCSYVGPCFGGEMSSRSTQAVQILRAVSAYCGKMEVKQWICSSHLQSGIGNGDKNGRVNLMFSSHDK